MRRPFAFQLAVLALGQFLVALDYNIVYVALPDIGQDLEFGPQNLQWVVTAYAVGFGGFLLFGGRATDLLGARRMFVLGLTLFSLGSLAAGFAPDDTLLIASRAVQGLGAALLSPASLALISSTFEEGAARNKALAIWGSAGSGGLAAGALLGGVLTDAWGWRWVFFVMVPIGLAVAIGTLRAIPAARPHPREGGFDVLGAVIVTAGSSLLVLGLVNGPAVGWLTSRGGGSLVAGLLLLGLFLLVERRTASPLVPLRLMRSRNLLVSMAVILLFQTSLGGAYYLFTTYLQNVLSYSPLTAGLAFLPLTVVSTTASLRGTAPLISRWGIRRALLIGMVVNGAGLAILAVGMIRDGSLWTVLPGLVVWGIGGGLTFPAMFAAAAAGVAPGEQGAASALATTSQQIGGALGLAVLVAIATAPSGLLDGLRLALFTAAALAVLGGLLALANHTRTSKGAPVTNTIVDDYFAAWNDTDADSRASRLQALLDSSVEIVDPDWTASGRDEAIDAIGQARTKLGDLRLGLGEVIHAHHDTTLFSWLLTDPTATTPIATGFGVLRTSGGRVIGVHNYFANQPAVTAG
ncbi:MFS transporter [Kribbella sp. NPDC023855]|uniref:MFS transporter n=1 Tax=Kribbella sp. NPDC023855 TaxID=3154698 RepID=UPI0033FFD5C4